MISNVENIKGLFKAKYLNGKFVTDKTGVKTIEIINASFEADKDYILRPPNTSYIKRELEWYESQSLNVDDIPGETPAIWKAVADKDGKINSNYGYLIFSEDNFSQYQSVLAELGENPDSRRATMIYTRPDIQMDAFSNGMSDFICTNNVQYFIRDNQLITSVYMRSNDAVFGYNNDLAWQKYVRDKLIDDLETDTYKRYEPGPIYWNVGSLHVYERHFELLDKYYLAADNRLYQL
ncbi:MAG TPA: dCMP hydroxymethylase [Xanthomarina gelatinilytica]|uniref:dCMP hydroxymethylase n=1 Tax=Xanthomarina gelatinilytica TaxID=1137281 RepID=A0A3D6BTP8_9FLAO|nr:dCMP hydroxymethylase [Xanthomarina gelatinilytica]